MGLELYRATNNDCQLLGSLGNTRTLLHEALLPLPHTTLLHFNPVVQEAFHPFRRWFRELLANGLIHFVRHVSELVVLRSTSRP